MSFIPGWGEIGGAIGRAIGGVSGPSKPKRRTAPKMRPPYPPNAGGPARKTKPKVIAGKGPNKKNPVRTRTSSGKASSGATPKTAVSSGKSGGGKPSSGGGGGKGGRGGKRPPTTPTAPTIQTPKVNFNAKKMARQLTDLGYDADLAAVQRAIDATRGQMENALADIQGWGRQLMDEHSVNAAATNKAWDDALAGSQASDANIAQLFGGVAAGENAAYSNVGEDMISAMGASDEAFNNRFGQALQAQGMDNSRRLQNMYNAQLAEQQAQQLDLQKEKGNAYAENLLNMMNMKWGRQQDLIQNQIAQQSLAQAAAMQGGELTIQQQQIEANKIANQGARIANRAARAELDALKNQQGGFDWNDPNTAAQVAQALFTGSINTNTGGLVINPQKAWKNVLDLMSGTYGVQGNPQAYNAAMALFRVSLRNSHARGQWLQYRINKSGQIVYDPTKAKRK